jgi:AraC-like DNA-binding protein
MRTAVRSSWLNSVVNESQRVAGDLLAIELHEARGRLIDFGRALPTPANRLEHLVMRAMLIDVAWRAGAIVHERAHRSHAAVCSFIPARCLGHFWKTGHAHNLGGFLPWVDAFFAEFQRTHPASVSSRAARLIRDDYRRPWSLAALARRVHVSPSQLRRAFQKEFGVPTREYQRAIRLIEAAKRFPTEKIEATALHVGYRSRKNLYRAFYLETGLTPAGFRELSNDEASRVIASIAQTRPPRAVAADRQRRR